MPQEVKINFSREHTGSTTGQPEVDTHRTYSDAPGKNEKIGHNPVNPGYGNTPVSVPVNYQDDDD